VQLPASTQGDSHIVDLGGVTDRDEVHEDLVSATATAGNMGNVLYLFIISIIYILML